MRAAASCSFLVRFASLLNSTSCYYFLLLNSRRSRSSAIDISSMRPWPPASVGSKPLVLWIGIFSSSLIYLISSAFLASSAASSSWRFFKASCKSLWTSSLIALLSCYLRMTYSAAASLLAWTWAMTSFFCTKISFISSSRLSIIMSISWRIFPTSYIFSFSLRSRAAMASSLANSISIFFF